MPSQPYWVCQVRLMAICQTHQHSCATYIYWAQGKTTSRKHIALKLFDENPHPYFAPGSTDAAMYKRAYIACIARWFWIRARCFRCHYFWNFVLYRLRCQYCALVLGLDPLFSVSLSLEFCALQIRTRFFVIMVVLCLHISRHFKKIERVSNFLKFTSSNLFECLRYRLKPQDK